jgi:hypothetical protein
VGASTLTSGPIAVKSTLPTPPDTLGNFYKNPWTANLGIPEAIEQPSDNPVFVEPTK